MECSYAPVVMERQDLEFKQHCRRWKCIWRCGACESLWRVKKTCQAPWCFIEEPSASCSFSSYVKLNWTDSSKALPLSTNMQVMGWLQIHGASKECLEAETSIVGNQTIFWLTLEKPVFEEEFGSKLISLLGCWKFQQEIGMTSGSLV